MHQEICQERVWTIHIAVCCSALQCVAVCCIVLHCVALCCSVLQCVAANVEFLQETVVAIGPICIAQMVCAHTPAGRHS